MHSSPPDARANWTGYGLLLRISTPDDVPRPFVAGVVVGVRSAPIVGYMQR